MSRDIENGASSAPIAAMNAKEMPRIKTERACCRLGKRDVTRFSSRREELFAVVVTLIGGLGPG